MVLERKLNEESFKNLQDVEPHTGELPNLCDEWTYERKHLAPFSASRVFKVGSFLSYLKGAVNAVVGLRRLGSVKKLEESSTESI